MKNSQLNRVTRLLARTGDKAVVLDQETEEVLVLLSLDSYEDLLSQAESSALGGVKLPDFSAPATAAAEISTKDRESVPVEGLEFGPEWEKNEDLGVAAEDDPAAIQEDEEEKFYLEPVE